MEDEIVEGNVSSIGDNNINQYKNLVFNKIKEKLFKNNPSNKDLENIIDKLEGQHLIEYIADRLKDNNRLDNEYINKILKNDKEAIEEHKKISIEYNLNSLNFLDILEFEFCDFKTLDYIINLGSKILEKTGSKQLLSRFYDVSTDIFNYGGSNNLSELRAPLQKYMGWDLQREFLFDEICDRTAEPKDISNFLNIIYYFNPLSDLAFILANQFKENGLKTLEYITNKSLDLHKELDDGISFDIDKSSTISTFFGASRLLLMEHGVMPDILLKMVLGLSKNKKISNKNLSKFLMISNDLLNITNNKQFKYIYTTFERLNDKDFENLAENIQKIKLNNPAYILKENYLEKYIPIIKTIEERFPNKFSKFLEYSFNFDGSKSCIENINYLLNHKINKNIKVELDNQKYDKKIIHMDNLHLNEEALEQFKEILSFFKWINDPNIDNLRYINGVLEILPSTSEFDYKPIIKGRYSSHLPGYKLFKTIIKDNRIERLSNLSDALKICNYIEDSILKLNKEKEFLEDDSWFISRLNIIKTRLNSNSNLGGIKIESNKSFLDDLIDETYLCFNHNYGKYKEFMLAYSLDENVSLLSINKYNNNFINTIGKSILVKAIVNNEEAIYVDGTPMGPDIELIGAQELWMGLLYDGLIETAYKNNIKNIYLNIKHPEYPLVKEQKLHEFSKFVADCLGVKYILRPANKYYTQFGELRHVTKKYAANIFEPLNLGDHRITVKRIISNYRGPHYFHGSTIIEKDENGINKSIKDSQINKNGIFETLALKINVNDEYNESEWRRW